MNLSKKKKLAKRTLNVGGDRIVFLESRLDEIKDAITKQDIRDLYNTGAIIIKERKGRKKVERNRSRSVGNVHKKVRKKKRAYIAITRKLRRHLNHKLTTGEISKESVIDIRKKIRNKYFKSKSHMKEYLGGIKK
jgi:large subunit ribosomal protein L19e